MNLFACFGHKSKRAINDDNSDQSSQQQHCAPGRAFSSLHNPLAEHETRDSVDAAHGAAPYVDVPAKALSSGRHDVAEGSSVFTSTSAPEGAGQLGSGEYPHHGRLAYLSSRDPGDPTPSSTGVSVKEGLLAVFKHCSLDTTTGAPLVDVSGLRLRVQHMGLPLVLLGGVAGPAGSEGATTLDTAASSSATPSYQVVYVNKAACSWFHVQSAQDFKPLLDAQLANDPALATMLTMAGRSPLVSQHHSVTVPASPWQAASKIGVEAAACVIVPEISSTGSSGTAEAFFTGCGLLVSYQPQDGPCRTMEDSARDLPNAPNLDTFLMSHIRCPVALFTKDGSIKFQNNASRAYMGDASELRHLVSQGENPASLVLSSPAVGANVMPHSVPVAGESPRAASHGQHRLTASAAALLTAAEMSRQSRSLDVAPGSARQYPAALNARSSTEHGGGDVGMASIPAAPLSELQQLFRLDRVSFMEMMDALKSFHEWEGTVPLPPAGLVLVPPTFCDIMMMEVGGPLARSTSSVPNSPYQSPPMSSNVIAPPSVASAWPERLPSSAPSSRPASRKGLIRRLLTRGDLGSLWSFRENAVAEDRGLNEFALHDAQASLTVQEDAADSEHVIMSRAAVRRVCSVANFSTTRPYPLSPGPRSDGNPLFHASKAYRRSASFVCAGYDDHMLARASVSSEASRRHKAKRRSWLLGARALSMKLDPLASTGRGSVDETTHGPKPVWHEVLAKLVCDPNTGEELILLTLTDVDDKVEAEKRAAMLLEAEHAILEQLFPRHVIEHMAAINTLHRMRSTEELGKDPGASSGDGGCSVDITATALAAVTEGKGSSGGDGGGKGAGRKMPGPVKAPGPGTSMISQIRKLQSTFATSHDQVTIMFADIVGFTSMCKCVSPSVVMNFLNELYSPFDDLVSIYKVYKVETAGDCYIVAGGLMRKDEDGYTSVRKDVDPVHAVSVLEFAKAMLRETGKVLNPVTRQPIQMRIGIHSGPVVSGVVGSKMPRFCLFGDTMNTAQRMESLSRPGAVHVSEATMQLLPKEKWEPTMGVEIKGLGKRTTYFWVPPSGGRPSPGQDGNRQSRRSIQIDNVRSVRRDGDGFPACPNFARPSMSVLRK